VWLFKLESPLPLLIGSGIGVLVLVSQVASRVLGRAKAS